MGIPLFFKYLCKKYPKCIIDLPFFLQTHNVDELYFDLNGLIHPACSNVKKRGHIQKSEIEEQVMNETRSEITKVIELVHPSNYVNLSVDGVAPFAKMNQQRGRRYKSYYINKKIQILNKKFNIESLEWDTNMISPGTPFMNNLMLNLNEFTNILKRKYKLGVDFSSSNEPGEGEHKIIQKIKGQNDHIRNKIIFGLDADLIMLSLISGISNIFLLRESKIFGENGTEFLVLDINELGNAIFQEVGDIYKNLQNDKLNIKKHDIITDYITLCFMVGNDFLPNLTMLSIDKGAINYLLKIYTQVLYKYNKCLVTKNSINWDIFIEIVEYMSKDEDNFVKIFHNNYNKKRYFEPNHLNEYDRNIRKLEYSPLISNVYNNIEYHKKGWRDRYYKRYLKVEYLRKKDINKIILSYLTGLQWTLQYYIEGCPCWSWYHCFECSPTVQDILTYLKNEKINITFELDTPLEPIKQLLCILPRKSLEIIPNTDKYIDDLEYLYPSRFHIDMLYKTYHHQCNIFLPKINYEYIKNYEIN